MWSCQVKTKLYTVPFILVIKQLCSKNISLSFAFVIADLTLTMARESVGDGGSSPGPIKSYHEGKWGELDIGDVDPFHRYRPLIAVFQRLRECKSCQNGPLNSKPKSSTWSGISSTQRASSKEVKITFEFYFLHYFLNNLWRTPQAMIPPGSESISQQ